MDPGWDLMKKAGFRPHIAGGIEPAASIGGMFMPPIMGAGGFIMAELTGMPYSRIMLVAVFPAIMYFMSVFVMVHYEAKMYKVVGERYHLGAIEILKKEWFYTLPLIVITVFVLTGYSPAYSAILGTVTCLLVSWVRPDTKMDLTLALVVLSIMIGSFFDLSQRVSAIPGLLVAAFIYLRFKQDSGHALKRFVEAARSGTENSLKIGATVGVIGIIIGVLTFSGLVLTFADIMIELAGGSLVLTILLVALASLVLGMGVPVTAAYLITAVVAVPALTHLGVNEIAAHMIVYWLSQDSNITPPAMAAHDAMIAGAGVLRRHAGFLERLIRAGVKALRYRRRVVDHPSESHRREVRMILPQVNVKKILYATDLSENARHAFAYAISLANLYRAGLTIVHVLPEDSGLDEKVIGYISAEKWEDIKEGHFQEARQTLIGKRREGMAVKEVLDRFCEEAQTGGTAFTTDEIMVLRGHPVEQILLAAEDRKCDMIVMGSRGYGALKDAMMGGTARRILRRAKVPVLLVRLPE